MPRTRLVPDRNDKGYGIIEDAEGHPLAEKIIELEVKLISLDSSPNTNKQNPQFDLGGQG